MGVLRKLWRGRFATAVANLHPGCHQIPNKTALNRYPEIFTAAAAAAPDARRILSFGCSTGEECITLADYFPKAQIVGADINPVNLLTAMRRKNDRIRYVYASDRLLNGFGGFDAVFCMAVLLTMRRKNIAQHYPFDRFAERARYLESLVRPGGVFVIQGATYRFCDAARGSYEAIPVGVKPSSAYLPDGITEVKSKAFLFRKRPADRIAQCEQAIVDHWAALSIRKRQFPIQPHMGQPANDWGRSSHESSAEL